MTANSLLPCYDDLVASEAYAWAMLARGVRDSRCAFHTPSIATSDADGAPATRIVVLRGCDAEARCLRFHTDQRASKLEDLRANPNVAMLFYDAQEKLQLRLHGTARLADAEQTQSAWEASQPMSRICYQVVDTPGAVLADPYAVRFDAAATQEGAVHFAAVQIDVASIEWLYLAAQGHRRARFDYRATPPNLQWPNLQWLVP